MMRVKAAAGPRNRISTPQHTATRQLAFSLTHIIACQAVKLLDALKSAFYCFPVSCNLDDILLRILRLFGPTPKLLNVLEYPFVWEHFLMGARE